MSSKKKLKFIDLFCGMGGFRIAFEKNGCKCVFSSDIDKYARKTYKMNFGEYPCGDITKISSSEIPDFDILCAGFPCQPFSIAGRRLGFEDDTQGTLFFDVARIIKEKQPLAFFLENVKGITNHDNGNTIKVITNSLKSLGYTIYTTVMNAKDYGIPQNRERWYCVGFRNDLNSKYNFLFPNKKSMEFNLSDIIGFTDDTTYKCTDICLNNINKFIDIKKIDVDDFTLAYEIRPSRCQFSTNLISPCLTAKMGTGGNNVPVVIKQKRRLTENECLKIMGYPSNYLIDKSSHTYKQIGNSVVVPILTTIAKKIVQTLNEK